MERLHGASVTQGHWSVVERDLNTTDLPSGSVILAAARVLGVTMDWLCLNSEERLPKRKGDALTSNEAAEAASVIDRMPPAQRVAALVAVRAIAGMVPKSSAGKIAVAATDERSEQMEAVAQRVMLEDDKVRFALSHMEPAEHEALLRRAMYAALEDAAVGMDDMVPELLTSG